MRSITNKFRLPDYATKFSFLLYLLSALILVSGLSASFVIYRDAIHEPTDVIGYDDGYPVTTEDSKAYLRDMELYGGKANVLADEFRRWFASLWKGPSLAYTIGCITVLVSLITFGVAYLLPQCKNQRE